MAASMLVQAMACTTLLQLAIIHNPSVTSGGEPLDDVLSLASNMESEVEDSDSFICDARNDHLIAAERDRSDPAWEAAKCGDMSDVEFVSKTRLEARNACHLRRGAPELTVDKTQACACCEIKCGPGSEKELMDMPIEKAAKSCEEGGFASMHDGFTKSSKLFLSKDRGCKCICPDPPLNGLSLFKDKAECELHNNTYMGCNKCQCKGSPPNNPWITQEIEQNCKNAKGKFHPEDCTCRCKHDETVKLFDKRQICASDGYTFDPVKCECECPLAQGQMNKVTVPVVREQCTGSNESNTGNRHFFDQTAGTCECKCDNTTYFEGKKTAHARKQCIDRGGDTMYDPNPCTCNCHYSDSYTAVTEAEKNCTNMYEGQGGVFSLQNRVCKCSCSDASEERFRKRSILNASLSCARPHNFTVRSKQCDCMCPSSSPWALYRVTEMKKECNNYPGIFHEPNCTCRPDWCPPESDPKFIRYPCCPSMDKYTCKRNCERDGGVFVHPFKCMCQTSDLIEAHLYEKMAECKNESAEFDPPTCSCKCSGGHLKGRTYAMEKKSCWIAGGQFDAPTCNCLCTEHKGHYHGSLKYHNISTVGQAKSSCKGTFTVADGVCNCEPLPSMPCCNDGTGKLISQFRAECVANGGRPLGNVADCVCSTDQDGEETRQITDPPHPVTTQPATEPSATQPPTTTTEPPTTTATTITTTSKQIYTVAPTPEPTPVTQPPCHPSCKTCKGPTDEDCETCSDTYPVRQQILCITQEQCTMGKYNFVDTITMKCTRCEPSCLTCHAGGPLQCLRCNDNFPKAREGTDVTKPRSDDTPGQCCDSVGGTGFASWSCGGGALVDVPEEGYCKAGYVEAYIENKKAGEGITLLDIGPGKKNIFVVLSGDRDTDSTIMVGPPKETIFQYVNGNIWKYKSDTGEHNFDVRSHDSQKFSYKGMQFTTCTDGCRQSRDEIYNGNKVEPHNNGVQGSYANEWFFIDRSTQVVTIGAKAYESVIRNKVVIVYDCDKGTRACPTCIYPPGTPISITGGLGTTVVQPAYTWRADATDMEGLTHVTTLDTDLKLALDPADTEWHSQHNQQLGDDN